MEAAFRVRLPPDQRHGSTLVFRCGSPLDPAALRMMSCATADTIILSGGWVGWFGGRGGAAQAR